MILAAFLAAFTSPLAGEGDVALQAGRIHVSATQVVEDGTVLISDGKIVAVGTDVEIPAGVRVVDYGDDAVLSPGLVCADSSYGFPRPGARTADPTVLAVDNFDPYTEMFDALREGVTTVYLVPARGRLIAGQGAVVKTGGDAESNRVLDAATFLQGAISAEARRTPGYWVPPVPATVDVGLGVEQAQLPRTTMGAIIALEELLALAAGDGDLAAEYGPFTGPALAAAIEAGQTWRMRADSPEEVRALLALAAKAGLPLVLEGAVQADEDLASEIAAAGVSVITGPHTLGGSDFGRGPDVAGPNHELVSTLARAGAQVVIATPGPSQLRFTVALAQRGGGLDRSQAFSAVTSTAAEVLGVANRVGSLEVGKDADIAVFTGHPMELSSGVVATWIDGEMVWEANARTAGPTVIEVDELHVGDGTVLRPGQLLIRGGSIREVAEQVAHPPGAVVVRAAAAMPGMIDALGHLGLEGYRQGFSTRFDLSRLVEPGDATDRAVARKGVTTVNLGSRESSGQTMVYKPAGENPSSMVLDPLASIRLTWSNSIRSERGKSVRSTLTKAKEYADKWAEYEKAIATWKPAAPEAPEAEEAEEGEEEEEEDDDKKKKKDKAPARPVTGEWTGTAKSDDLGVNLPVRVRLLERDLRIEGNVRSEGFEDLWILEGSREEYAVHLTGTSPAGLVTLELELEDDTLKGTGTHDGNEVEVELTQTSDVYPVAGRPDRVRPEVAKAPKGKPKPAGINAELEPIRRAMSGRGAVFISVSSSDEAIEATEACEEFGIKPIIWNADRASGAASRLRGRIAGAVVRSSGAAWAEWGIPVAFYSGAEEGAGELSLHAATAIGGGMSPVAALRALTSDAAKILSVDHRIGSLRAGLDADVLLLDGSPLNVSSTVLRAWVGGKEIR